MGEQHSYNIVSLLFHGSVGGELRRIYAMEDRNGGFSRWGGEAGEVVRSGSGVFGEDGGEGVEGCCDERRGAEGTARGGEEVRKGEVAFAEEED